MSTSLLDELIGKIEGMSPQQRAAVEKEAMQSTKEMVWIPSPGPQTEAYFCKADELFFGGQAGGGKGFAPDQKVLTPFGWKEIGSLKVGSDLCATDGTVQRVIGVYPRGVQPFYKLTWSDGTITECDEDHIWLAWEARGSRKIGNAITSAESASRKWTTIEIYNHYRKESGGRIGIPVISKPATFNVHGENAGRHKHISREIPPYILGVLLGNGSIVAQTKFYSADPEIADRVSSLCSHPVTVHSQKNGTDCKGYYIPKDAYWDHLNDLGLIGTRLDTKFIPRIYLFGSAEERWELLRGLMDTDGWCDKDGDCYYVTASEKLADDVRHLARSLGAIVHKREKETTYTYCGETLQGKLSYVLRIKMNDPSRMFHLERKKTLCTNRRYQSMALWLESIEKIENKESVCIAVSHPNSLFVTEGFVVTHNTALGIGLALTAHHESLILRRQSKEAMKLFDHIESVLGHTDGRNMSSSSPRWTIGKRQIDIGGCLHEHDKQKFKGIPHDLIFFDELPDFTRSQYEFIKTWNRSSRKGQRCRVVGAGNPPTTAEGLWVIEYWAAWLDPRYPNPAKSGEIRHFVSDRFGNSIEVPKKGRYMIDHKDKSATPVSDDDPRKDSEDFEFVSSRSRCFIRSGLKDNPFLYNTDYGAALDALPEEIRRAYRDGRFDLSIEDNLRQIIPTAWIMAAKERWTPKPPPNVQMCAIGVDIAQGGKDNTILAPRYDGWFAPLICVPGEKTPNGKSVVALIVAERRDGALPIIDMGGGYGGATVELLEDNGIKCCRYKGALDTNEMTNDKTLHFANVRTKAYWRLREALDPDQPGGSSIALPDDPRLISDLTALTFEVKKGKNGRLEIAAETKEDVCARLGRSTDHGDAVVMAWHDGLKSNSGHRIGYSQRVEMPKVNLGYTVKRRR